MGKGKISLNIIIVIQESDRILLEKIDMNYRLQDLEYLVVDCVLGKSKKLRMIVMFLV